MSRVALLLRALEYKPTEACSSPLGGPGRGEGGRRETGGRRASLGLERGGEVAKLLFGTWGPENRGLLGRSVDQLTYSWTWKRENRGLRGHGRIEPAGSVLDQLT
jgi:hypothetical protein